MIVLLIISSVYAASVSYFMTVAIRKYLKHASFYSLRHNILFSFVAGLIWPYVLGVSLRQKIRSRRPRPMPKKIREYLKRDIVSFNGSSMTLAEYNARYGKQYSMEEIFGKKYVAALTEKNIKDLDEGTLLYKDRGKKNNQESGFDESSF